MAKASATNSPPLAEFTREQGLRYVSDEKPGITRRKRGKGYAYFDVKGNRITDAAELKRIHAIGIPPAYQRVWISPWPNGHILATGLDAKGRKQYRYHPKWRQSRDETKFQHILEFGERLGSIRKRVEQDLKLPGLPRDKVLAAVVRLLEVTLIRVGNAEYARDNDSYGLTTMRKKHVDTQGDTVKFHFTGKSGKEWNLNFEDRRIAAVVKHCADIPGYELFKYFDEDGNKHDVDSADVNAYLREIAGSDFTAKDFRTWAGTVLAAMALKEVLKFDSTAQAKKNVVRVIENVARQLGNTPAICRKCYVHPEVMSAYMDGSLADMLEQKIEHKVTEQFASLDAEEVMVLAFLKKRLEKQIKAA